MMCVKSCQFLSCCAGSINFDDEYIFSGIYELMNWVSIGSGNGLSPVLHQAITQTNADILSIGLLETNFNEILIDIHDFSFMKMHLKMSSVKWWLS